jgi:hypothetical protein
MPSAKEASLLVEMVVYSCRSSTSVTTPHPRPHPIPRAGAHTLAQEARQAGRTK